MKSIIFILSIVVMAASCTYTHKARVLENGSTIVLELNESQNMHLGNGDIVWANLSTHEINDLDSNTMKVVLIGDYDHSYTNPREYQIELNNDTVEVYDGNRVVGKYIIDDKHKSPIDSIFINDNL